MSNSTSVQIHSFDISLLKRSTICITDSTVSSLLDFKMDEKEENSFQIISLLVTLEAFAINFENIAILLCSDCFGDFF